MSRQIKFRAWDEADGIHRDKGVMSYGVRHDGDATAIMQFTGLMDRNGREIYESDILECGEPLPLTGTPCKERLPKEPKYNVIWHEGAFKIAKSGAGRRFHLTSVLIRQYGLTIIGNKYEK